METRYFHFSYWFRGATGEQRIPPLRALRSGRDDKRRGTGDVSVLSLKFAACDDPALCCLARNADPSTPLLFAQDDTLMETVSDGGIQTQDG